MKKYGDIYSKNVKKKKECYADESQVSWSTPMDSHGPLHAHRENPRLLAALLRDMGP